MDSARPQASGASTACAGLHQPSIGARSLRARLQDYFGKPTHRDGRTILATWHPSYALRAPDAETRERAYADLVHTLTQAKRLAHAPRKGAASKD